MTEGALHVLGIVTIRDLRQDPVIAPNGVNFPSLIQRLLPLVYGTAASLIPEDPAAVEGITIAVCESFAFQWRSLSKTTFVARWLLRTTWFAVVRERRRLGLKARPSASGGMLVNQLLKRLNRLKIPLQDSLILLWMLQESLSDTAQALRHKPSRVEKWSKRALAKLANSLQKTMAMLTSRRMVEGAGDAHLPELPTVGGHVFNEVTDVRALMAAIPQAAPAELEHQVLSRLKEWSPEREKSRLVKETLRSWRWVAMARFFKGLAKGLGATVGALVILGLSVAHLAQQGYLTMWFLQITQKNILKEFPELAQPARPWPAATAPRQVLPKTSAELFGLTNIWLAKLSLTPEQWKATQPAHVPPAPSQNGRMQLRNPKASRSGLAGAIGIDFRWSAGTLEFAGKKFENIGVRYRGNGTFVNSLYGSKQSLKVDLNRHEKGLEVGGVSTLNFVNSIPDFSYMKDALAEKLFRDLGVVAPRTAYAYLSLDVPGKFTNQALGLYVLIENIDGDFAKDRFGSKATPVFKPVTYDLFSDLGKSWKDYSEIYDLKTKATEEQLDRVVQLAKLVSHADDSEFAQRLPEFLDLEEFAAFLAGHVLLSSYDGFLSNGQNFYVYLDPRTNKFGFISWDQDHGWGEFGYTGKAETRERASIWHPSTTRNLFLDRVMKVDAFRDIYRRKLEQALQDYFTVEKLFPAIDSLATIIRPAVAAESDFRLKRFELAISTNWVAGPRDGNMRDGNAEGPKAPTHQLKRFILARTKSVREQLNGENQGERVSGFN